MNTEKKYEFTGEINSAGLQRIRRLSDKKIGGWIESEDNLSHRDKCWVDDNAQVSGKARVFGDALVYGNARVYGFAKVYGRSSVYDSARVYDSAKVYADACVFGSASVHGNCAVFNNAWVHGSAWVAGNAFVFDSARVYDGAFVKGNSNIGNNANVSGLAIVSGNARICGNAHVFGSAHVYGDAQVCNLASVYDSAMVHGHSKILGNRKVSGSEEVSVDELNPEDREDREENEAVLEDDNKYHAKLNTLYNPFKPAVVRPEEAAILVQISARRSERSESLTKLFYNLSGHAYWIGRLILDKDCILPGQHLDAADSLRSAAQAINSVIAFEHEYVVILSQKGEVTYKVKAADEHLAHEAALRLYDKDYPSISGRNVTDHRVEKV